MYIEDRLTELEGAVRDHTHMHETIKMLERVQALEKQVAELSVELNGMDETVTRSLASVEKRVADLEKSNCCCDTWAAPTSVTVATLEEVPDEAVVCELPKKDVEINCRPPCPECGVCNGHNPSCSHSEPDSQEEEPKRYWANRYPTRFGVLYTTKLKAESSKGIFEIGQLELVEADAYDRLKAENESLKVRNNNLKTANRRWDEENGKLRECLSEIGSDGIIYGSTFEEAIAVLRHWRETINKLKEELETSKSAYDRLRAIYDELTDDLRSVFSGSNPILLGFSPSGRDMGKEAIRLAQEYKLLEAERNVLREFVEACFLHPISAQAKDYEGRPGRSNSAKCCLELADAARRGSENTKG